jgi:hypothetical protein
VARHASSRDGFLQEIAQVRQPLIYMIRADIDADYVEPHHAWYARRHAPDLMAAGFWSARGFDSPKSPGLWNIYEVPDVAIFSSEAYNSGHRSDPFLETAVNKLHGRTVSLYTQVETLDGDGRKIDRLSTLRAPVVTVLRFETSASSDAIVAWFRETVVPAQTRAGVRSVRLWEQREQHPKWPSTEPRWSVGVEWDSASALESAGTCAPLEQAAAALKLGASKVRTDVVTRRYSLVREDVFND